MAEDELFERSCRIAATSELACRANSSRWQSSDVAQNKFVAEIEGFEPSHPGSQDITDFKSGALSRSAKFPKIKGVAPLDSRVLSLSLCRRQRACSNAAITFRICRTFRDYLCLSRETKSHPLVLLT